MCIAGIFEPEQGREPLSLPADLEVHIAISFDAVLLALLPAYRTYRVEHSRKLTARFGKCGSLGLSRVNRNR